MSPEEQIKLLTLLKDSRVSLPYYRQIEENVDRALIDSYERKASILRDSPNGFYTFQDKEIKTCQHSQIMKMGDAPLGFAIIGESGCGKTNGIHNVIQKYPKVIIHNMGTMQQHIQIPILLVDMPDNSNFHGFYQETGRVLDKILGNTMVYEKELSRKGTLNDKFFRLCKILEVFNVGLLLVDEIEHISKKRVSDGTLETFMSLSNQTGTAVGVIGNEDSFSKLFYKPRVVRRMGEFINADFYRTNTTTTRTALKNLYSYLPYDIPLTDECINVYQNETNGIIFYILQLFIHVAIVACKMIGKGHKPNITPKMLQSIAKQCLANKKIGEKYYLKTKIIEDQEYANETLRLLIGNKNSETINTEDEENNKVPIPTGNSLQNTINAVKAAIHAFRGDDFNDKQIEAVLQYVLKKNSTSNMMEIISATHAELCRRKEEKENKEKMKQQEKENLLNVEKILENLPVSTIKGIKPEGTTHHE